MDFNIVISIDERVNEGKVENDDHLLDLRYSGLEVGAERRI